MAELNEETPSVMEMSDEDFAKLAGPPGVPVDPPADPVIDPPTDPVVVDPVDPPEVVDPVDPDPVDPPAADPVDPPVEADPPPDAGIDYKAEYERLMAPFKANGGEIKVQNTDEIIQLMQFGANYHKKMQGLKPSLKIMKLLERNELLDEGKLSYLIDLSKKDPAAITKLIKDAGIDPLAIDTTAADGYTPKTPKVSDLEMDLDAVLEQIQETPTYNQTLKVVSETWDDASRNTIAASPHIIAIINEHIGNGTFAQVSSEVDRARRFGKLQGVSDFDAYKLMGDYLQGQGKLGTAVQPTGVNTDIPTKKEADDKRKELKKAAAVTPSKTTSTTTQPLNPLALSDDEFSKLSLSAYTKLK